MLTAPAHCLRIWKCMCMGGTRCAMPLKNETDSFADRAHVELAEQIKLTRHSHGSCRRMRNPDDWWYIVSKKSSDSPLYAFMCSRIDVRIMSIESVRPRNRVISSSVAPQYQIRSRLCLIEMNLFLWIPTQVLPDFFQPNI
jgi:hypothetical protein